MDPACVDIANSLTLTLLYLIDSESTRGFLRPSVDLVRLISVFTDTTAADNPERENRRAAAHKALVMLMRSWTGILVLTADPQCLRSLIGMLNLPASVKGSNWARETIFDLLFEVVHVVKAADVRAVATRIRRSMAAVQVNGKNIGVSHAYPPNLLHSYMVMLLLAFLECDLVEILTQLALSTDVEFASVASKLLGEILGLSAELLPRDITQRLNSMKHVIASAATFGADASEAAFANLSSASLASASSDADHETSRRTRASHVLSTLAHGEMSAIGPSAGSGFGIGNNGAAQTAPGTGWAWTGHIGINWEQVQHTAALAAKESRRESEWSQGQLGGGSGSGGGGMVRNSSFSGSRPHHLSSADAFLAAGGVEHTPTGRRAILHGIRLERLAIRCDLFPNSARMVSSGAYGNSVAGNADLLAPIASLVSQPSLADRNNLRHRLGLVARSTAHTLARLSADFHTEEADLAAPLKKSQVLSTKEFQQWDWEYIQMIIEKYMMVSPTHTAYLVLKTKFPKRLLSFLRADKHHFIDLDWNVFHLRFARMGVAIVKAMLGSSEGREYSWFIEFVDGLFLSVLWEIASTDGKPQSNVPIGGTGFVHSNSQSVVANLNVDTHPAAYTAGRRLSHLSSGLSKTKAKIFQSLSRSGLQTRLMREYFVFLGVLATSPHGHTYFDKYNFFEVIANLGRDPAKDYITKWLIAHTIPLLTPTAQSHHQMKWRRVIEGWFNIPVGVKDPLPSANVYLRMWMVEHILIGWRHQQSTYGSSTAAAEIDLTGPGVLSSQPMQSIHAIVAHASLTNPGSLIHTTPDPSTPDNGTWIVTFLLNQLASLDLNLRAAVLGTLEEICINDPSALNTLIARRPTILKEMAAMLSTDHQPLFPAAQRLLTLFLSTKPGVEFLRAAGLGGASWLDGQLNEWKFTPSNGVSQCILYARSLEDALVSALAATTKDDSDHVEEGLSQAGPGGAAKMDELIIATPTSTGVPSAWNGPPMRSALDEHIFERLHSLPWTVDLTVEYPQGRSVQVMTECWVVTTSHTTTPSSSRDSPSSHTTRPSSMSDDFGSTSVPPPSAPPSDPIPFGAPVTYLVCQILDLNGSPRPTKIEPNVTLRARIGIGAGVNSANVQDLSTGGQPLPTLTDSRINTRNYGVSISKDIASSFQEEREPDLEWARTFFPDSSGHASEYICRPRDRDRLTPDTPVVVTPNSSDLCQEDEACWQFEVPDPSLAPMTHSSARGPVSGSSAPNAITLESIWFPLPIPTSTIPSITLLPHLYGELARTDDGAAVLAQSGQLRELERCIRENGLSGCEGTASSQSNNAAGFIHLPSSAASLEKRAALWAIGHIGSTNFGFQLIQQQAPDLIPYISRQAVRCSTLSMRGTCFYVLGLLGRSSVGQSFLANLGWAFSPFPGGCIAIPRSVNSHEDDDTRAHVKELQRRTFEQEQYDFDEEDDTQLVPRSSLSLATSEDVMTVHEKRRTGNTPDVTLERFLHLDWPSSSYKGSWATDPTNIYGINSSKRTRKVGGGDETGTGEEKSPSVTPKEDMNEVLSSQDGIEVILSHLSNLCNHVTQKNSLQSLRTLNSKPHQAHFFTSPLLLFETFKLLSCYSYKLPARRFLFFDLFGTVAFNMHTIAQFDQPFLAENVASAKKQKARGAAQAATPNNSP